MSRRISLASPAFDSVIRDRVRLIIGANLKNCLKREIANYVSYCVICREPALIVSDRYANCERPFHRRFREFNID